MTFNLRNLARGELIAMTGGALLFIGTFVKCYETRPQNPNANIDGVGGPEVREGLTPGDGTFSFWQVHDITRFLVLAAAIAPFILAWIIVREHELSWPRGQVTMIVGLAAAALIFYWGIIDRPGDPPGEIELEIGWYGMLLGSLLMVVGAVMRSEETGRERKPPGIP